MSKGRNALFSSTADRLNDLRCDLRESVEDDGLLRVELWSEGAVIVTAQARRDQGQGKDDIRVVLRDALVDHVQMILARVELTAPQSKNGSRWESRYVQTDGNNIFIGPVWFDAASDQTGPSDVAAIVRTKMRFETRSALDAKRPGTFGMLLEILNAMSG